MFRNNAKGSAGKEASLEKKGRRKSGGQVLDDQFPIAQAMMTMLVAADAAMHKTA
jgi:hypothetical protein